MVTNSPAIKLIDADFGYTKSSKTTSVLTNCNIELNFGDFVTVIGNNGSGKSTLLKSIAGLNPILKGEIVINQTNINNLSYPQLSELVSIALTQKISGFNLTCYDFVAMGQIQKSNLFNQLSNESKSIISHAISICKLTEHQHKLLNELSDGLFQKTVIAKCLAQQTPVMLLDEPSAFLDYSSKHELFLLLKELAITKNKCILVSTHELDLVLKYCSKIILVNANKINLLTVEEAKQSELFKKLSGGFISF